MEHSTTCSNGQTTQPYRLVQQCAVHSNPGECGDTTAENYRVDSETGECMKEGWIFFGGLYDIADEERAQRLSNTLWGLTLEEAYSDDSDDVYYTEWQ